jgi:hypothetical protein
MKKYTVILMLVLFVSSGYAIDYQPKPRRPYVELATRGSIYVNYLSDGTDFAFGADIVFNPSAVLGCKVGITEIYFHNNVIFNLNQNFLSLLPKIDILIYASTRRTQPYIHLGFGVFATEGGSALIFGGGLGLDYFVTRNSCLSMEPGLYAYNISSYALYGSGHTEWVFRLSLGVKYGIAP